jgi:hypothetical protein
MVPPARGYSLRCGNLSRNCFGWGTTSVVLSRANKGALASEAMPAFKSSADCEIGCFMDSLCKFVAAHLLSFF